MKTEEFLVSLGLTIAASVAGAVIWKKVFGSGTATLVFSNEYLNDTMKVLKSLEESGLPI